MRKYRISVYKQDRLIEHFVSGSTALFIVHPFEFCQTEQRSLKVPTKGVTGKFL